MDDARFPPALVAAAIQGIALLVVREQVLGLRTDHESARAAFEAILQELEEQRARAMTRRLATDSATNEGSSAPP